MGKYIPLDLKTQVNNRGCTTRDECKSGFLSFGGGSLPAEQIPFDRPFSVDAVPFVFSQSEASDNMECRGQIISFPTCLLQRLHVLGVSNNGSLFDDVSFLRDEDIMCQGKLYLSDFVSNRPAFTDRSAFVFSYVHIQAGPYEHIKPHIWYFPIDLPQATEINGLRFEDNPSMHIFALTLEFDGKGSFDGIGDALL